MKRGFRKGEVAMGRDHATGPRLMIEFSLTPLKSIGGPTLAPANVVAVMTAGSAAARLTSGEAAGVCCAGRAMVDSAAVVVWATDGVAWTGSAIDEAPTAGRVSVVEVVTAGGAGAEEVVSGTAADVMVAGVLESSTLDDELGVETAGVSGTLVLMAAELGAGVSTALDDPESAIAELDDGISTTLDVLRLTAAELDTGTAAADDVLGSTVAELNEGISIALDELGSTAVSIDVDNEFKGVSENACEGTSTTAGQLSY